MDRLLRRRQVEEGVRARRRRGDDRGGVAAVRCGLAGGRNDRLRVVGVRGPDAGEPERRTGGSSHPADRATWGTEPRVSERIAGRRRRDLPDPHFSGAAGPRQAGAAAARPQRRAVARARRRHEHRRGGRHGVRRLHPRHEPDGGRVRLGASDSRRRAAGRPRPCRGAAAGALPFGRDGERERDAARTEHAVSAHVVVERRRRRPAGESSATLPPGAFDERPRARRHRHRVADRCLVGGRREGNARAPLEHAAECVSGLERGLVADLLCVAAPGGLRDLEPAGRRHRRRTTRPRAKRAAPVSFVRLGVRGRGLGRERRREPRGRGDSAGRGHRTAPRGTDRVRRDRSRVIERRPAARVSER